MTVEGLSSAARGKQAVDGASDLITIVGQRGQETGRPFGHREAEFMVKLVGRFSADRGEIFDDPPGRTPPVDTFEVFVGARRPTIPSRCGAAPGWSLCRLLKTADSGPPSCHSMSSECKN